MLGYFHVSIIHCTFDMDYTIFNMSMWSFWMHVPTGEPQLVLPKGLFAVWTELVSKKIPGQMQSVACNRTPTMQWPCLTPSLPWCHLKTIHIGVKFETFKVPHGMQNWHFLTYSYLRMYLSYMPEFLHTSKQHWKEHSQQVLFDDHK